MDSSLPSAPENYKQLIKRSIWLYRASFLKIILFALLFSIITFIPRYASIFLNKESLLSSFLLNPQRLWLFIIDIIALPFFIAILWHMYCVIRQKNEPLIEDLVIGLKKIVQVFLAVFIQAAFLLIVAITMIVLQQIYLQSDLFAVENFTGLLLLSVGFVLQLFLLVYMQTLFIFLLPLIVIEKKGVFKALSSSVSLVWSHWGKTFCVQITPWLCYLFILLAMKLIFRINIHIYFLENTHHPLGPVLMNTIIFALIVPWIAAVMIIQLKDLELRKNF